MVNEEARVTLYQEYMTMSMKALADVYFRSLGIKHEFPSFIDMTHEKPKPETKEEIIERLTKKLS